MYEYLYDRELKLLAKKIKEEREKLGFSQEQFAHNIGISQSQQANIENNRSIPSVLDLVKICKFLKKSPNEFLKHFQSYEEKINKCFEKNKDKLSEKGLAGVDPLRLDLRSKIILLESTGILKKSKRKRKSK